MAKSKTPDKNVLAMELLKAAPQGAANSSCVVLNFDKEILGGGLSTRGISIWFYFTFGPGSWALPALSLDSPGWP